MKNSISRNYIYNLSYQILTLITPLITTPYLSRVLGADGIGVYSYTTSIVSYFILLASMGIPDYAQREIAYHQDDRYLQSRTFYEVISIRTLLVSLSLCLYYFVLSKVGGDHVIYWIQSLNIAAVLFDISWFFQGLEEFGKIVFRNLVVRILNIFCIFLFIHQASDLLLYIFLMGCMNVLAAVSIWIYLPGYLVKVRRQDIKPFRNFIIIIQMFLPQIAIQVYTVLDKTMIGAITSSAFENGYYEQAEKIVKMLLMVVTSLGTVMVPRIASAYAHHETQQIKSYIMRSYRFVWMIGLPMAGILIALIDTAVPWFFGPGYEKVGELVKVFSGLLLAIGSNNDTGGQYLIPVGLQNIFTLTVLIGAAVNFILNSLLISRFMSMGAVIASVAAETVIAVVQFYFVRKQFSLWEVIKSARTYFIDSLFMFLLLEVLQFYFHPSPTVFTSVWLGCVGVIFYGTFLYLKKDDLFIYLLDKLARKVYKRL